MRRLGAWAQVTALLSFVMAATAVAGCKAGPDDQTSSSQVTVERVRQGATPADAEEAPGDRTAGGETGRDVTSNPTERIRYTAASRTSSRWVDAGGAQVAIDEGLVGHGVEAYLSLTDDLVVLDGVKKDTLWSMSVGAFWNELAFTKVLDETSQEETVLLRLGEFRSGRFRYFIPTTGEERYLVTVDGNPTASAKKPADLPGDPIPLDPAVDGPDSQIEAAEYQRVLAEAEWTDLWERHGGAAEAMPAADFDKQMVIAVFLGRSWNSRGILANAFDTADEIIVHLQRRSYQTIGGGDQVTPYAFLVMPRSGKKVVLKLNVQRYIGGPPVWKPIHEFEAVR